MIPTNFLYFSLNLTEESKNNLINFFYKFRGSLLRDKKITGEYYHHCTLFHINDKHPYTEELRNYLYSSIKKRLEEDREKVYKIKVIGFGISNRALAFKIDSNSIPFPKLENHIYHITAYTFNNAKPYESNNISNWYGVFDNPIEVECVLVENLKEIVVDGYLLNTETEIIKGHYDLELKVGNQYRINYGVHKGIYEYVGKVSDKDNIHIHSHGEHLFKKCETGEITFGYYGYSSPYEFTSIVQPFK